MTSEREVLRSIARAPMRTVRPRDLVDRYAHPGPRLAALAERGVVHRLAHGVYCAVPTEHVGTRWRPALEAATAAIATALYGDRVPVLTGVTAARVHQAWPRAVGAGFVAVPTQRRPLDMVDRHATVHFVTRAVERLDAVATITELGTALVTTPEQTILDLARADPRGEDPEVQAAVDALWVQCDPQVLAEIVPRQRMRATYERVVAGR